VPAPVTESDTGEARYIVRALCHWSRSL